MEALRRLTVPRPRRIVEISARTGARRTLFRAGDGQIIGPAATPDGRRIAFILRRSPRRLSSGLRLFAVRDEIWTMDGNGGHAHSVKVLIRRRQGCCHWVYPLEGALGGQSGLTSIDISDDGKRLVVIQGNCDIYSLRIDGSAYRHVDLVGGEASGHTGSDISGPQFVPGGTRLVGHFTADDGEGIGTVPLTGGRVRYFDLDRNALAPTYSDDGRWIAFTVEAPSPVAHPHLAGRDTLWIMRAEGSGIRRVVGSRRLDVFNPAFSPDGREIVFGAQSIPPGSRVIGKQPIFTYIVPVDGGRPIKVSTGVLRFYNENPAWIC